MSKFGLSLILILVYISKIKCHESDDTAPTAESNTCGDGFEYLKCGPVCQDTCDPALLHCQNVSTNNNCLPGCFCKDGLVFHIPTGTCVKKSDCRTTCAKNMEYQECGTACPATCKNPNATNCTVACREGCFCKKNLVQDTESGTCIHPKDCKPQCPDNMVYQDCGPVFPHTCFPMPYNEIYNKECVVGCFCKDGYLLNNGTCIKVEDCPKKKCPSDMEFQECVKDCPPTCRYRSGKDNCFQECIKGCVCKKGLVYNKDKNKCVKVDECAALCPENWEFVDCKNSCPATCENPKRKSVCDKPCVQGCQCLGGMLLDTKTQNCIVPDDCRRECLDCPKWVFGHV